MMKGANHGGAGMRRTNGSLDHGRWRNSRSSLRETTVGVPLLFNADGEKTAPMPLQHIGPSNGAVTDEASAAVFVGIVPRADRL